MSIETPRFAGDSKGNVEDLQVPSLMNKLAETLSTISGKENSEEYWNLLREKLALWKKGEIQVLLHDTDARGRIAKLPNASRIEDSLRIVLHFHER